MNTVTYLHIAMELWGALFCIIATVVLVIAQINVPNRLHSVIQIEFLNAILLISDVFARIYRGNTTVLGYYMVRISNFLVFLIGYLSLAIFAYYIQSLFKKESRDKWKTFFKGIYFVCGTLIVLLFINIFTKWFYYFDETNRYHRSKWFPVSQITSAVCLVILGIIVYLLRRELKKGFFVVIESYLILPILALVMQVFLYGFSLLNLATTIACLELFFVSYIDHVIQLKEKQQQLQETQISLLMSRIQPHFLFNCMSTIRYLCKRDVEEATTAIDVFSDYLRFNIDCMGARECISFEADLEHAQNYLRLEKKRFQDALAIEIETPHMDFSIPALTIQPLVENAVRHGVRQNENGGTVWIRTCKDQDNYQIIIEDDGPGFEVGAAKEDGKVHVGIENVKKRLELMCHGRLEIQSVIGQGTKCIIYIPMEDT